MDDGEKIVRVAIQKAYGEMTQQKIQKSARGYFIARRAWELIINHIQSGMTFETWAWGTALLENPEQTIKKIEKLDKKLEEENE